MRAQLIPTERALIVIHVACSYCLLIRSQKMLLKNRQNCRALGQQVYVVVSIMLSNISQFAASCYQRCHVVLIMLCNIDFVLTFVDDV